jgi:hypothetical protein
MSLIQMVLYQGSLPGELWEQRHIDAMNNVCDYIKDVHPSVYNRVKFTHDRFVAKAEDL